MLALAPLPALAQQVTKIRVRCPSHRQFRSAAGRTRERHVQGAEPGRQPGASSPRARSASKRSFGGSAELAGNSVIEPLIARGNGLDVMYLINNTRIRPTPPDNSGIAVRYLPIPSIGPEGPRRQARLGRPDQRSRTTSI
jgi:hypothetical protein